MEEELELILFVPKLKKNYIKFNPMSHNWKITSNLIKLSIYRVLFFKVAIEKSVLFSQCYISLIFQPNKKFKKRKASGIRRLKN